MTASVLLVGLALASPDSGLATSEKAFLISVAADVTTTLMAGRAGYNVPDWYGWREDNPLADYLLSRDKSNGLFIAGEIAYSVGTVYLTRRIRRSNPKMADALLVGLTCVHTYLAIKNATIYVRLKIRHGKVRP